MLRVIVRRLLQLVVTLLALSALIFIWLRNLPGGPVDALLGERATPETRALLTKALGYDQPIWVQYGKFMQRTLSGDFGNSIRTGDAVTAVIGRAFPATDAPRRRAGHADRVGPRRAGRRGRRRVRGWVDVALMRLTDVMLALPSLLLAITLVAMASRSSQWTVILAVAIVNVPIFARLLRGAMLAQRESDHVLAARALGVRQRTIVLRHMLPNSMTAVLVQATLTFAVAILDAAALSFLGLGDPDINRAEWGLMLGVDGQRYFEVRPELAYFPALAIVVVALGFTLLGEAIDPKNRR